MSLCVFTTYHILDVVIELSIFSRVLFKKAKNYGTFIADQEKEAK